MINTTTEVRRTGDRIVPTFWRVRSVKLFGVLVYRSWTLMSSELLNVRTDW